MFVYLITT